MHVQLPVLSRYYTMAHVFRVTIIRVHKHCLTDSNTSPDLDLSMLRFTFPTIYLIILSQSNINIILTQHTKITYTT